MKVRIYTAPGCVYCLIAQNFFRKNRIPFTVTDISEDPKAKEEMQKKSGQESVPVFEIGKEIIVGYDIKKIKEAIGME